MSSPCDIHVVLYVLYLTKAVDEQDEDCGEDSRNRGPSVLEGLVETIFVIKT